MPPEWSDHHHLLVTEPIKIKKINLRFKTKGNMNSKTLQTYQIECLEKIGWQTFAMGWIFHTIDWNFSVVINLFPLIIIFFFLFLDFFSFLLLFFQLLFFQLDYSTFFFILKHLEHLRYFTTFLGCFYFRGGFLLRGSDFRVLIKKD